MKIEEVQSTTKKQRVASHTHIKGLGLKVTLPVYALPLAVLSLFFLGASQPISPFRCIPTVAESGLSVSLPVSPCPGF